MPKLSSARLKAMIPLWLSCPSLRQELRCHSDPGLASNDPREQREWLDQACDRFGLPVGSSAADLEARVWSLWCDPGGWKRIEKRKLKDNWDSYFHETCGAVMGDDYVHRHGQDECLGRACTEPRRAELESDLAGGHDQAHVDACWNSPARAAACWLRVFVPDSDLRENYRLEVVTTPDDDAVVGWTVITD